MVMKHTLAQRQRRAVLAQKNASPRQRKELARRKRMGIGIIEKPLRFIAEQTDSYVLERGVKTRVESDETRDARQAAKYGDGGFVRHIAFDVLRRSA